MRIAKWLGIVTIVIGVGCSDRVTEPISLAIIVTTASTGVEIDSDGYAVAVDGGSPQPIGANTALTIPDLTAGVHHVKLLGVAINCTVQGENPRTITVVPGETITAAFQVSCVSIVFPSPQSGRIAFASDRDGNTEIYIANPGEWGARLTTNPGFDGNPAISPDGTRILFETDRAGQLEIFVMNADGSG